MISIRSNGTTPSGLARRLATVADVLLGTDHRERLDDSARLNHGDPGATLDALVRHVQADPDPARLWLLYGAIATALPDEAQLRRAQRYLELHRPVPAGQWLLTQCLRTARQVGSPGTELRIVTAAIVVDVDTSARNEIHTGIQRVVRSTLPRWQLAHDLHPVAWTSGRAMLRSLSATESDRASGRPLTTPNPGPDADPEASPDQVLVLPWRSTLVLAEVPTRDVCARLSALAQHSGNRVVAIGYDCIPVISADLVPAAEPNRFVRYLSVLKHADEVAAISSSAATEFAGFTAMLPAQGLRGPRVTECGLPVGPVSPVSPASPAGAVTAPLTAPPEQGRPLVLCVGRLEPRKNQLAVLDAAQRLWREGHDFELRLIGGGSRERATVAAARRLRRAGHPITLAGPTDDAQLSQAYDRARFSVFVSVHEGYGLPVAESLAHGTPVLTSDYGSPAEIAAGGGAVLVDPRDDDAITEAMRRLLLDDALLAELVDDIARRPARTWDDYADQLWQTVTGAGRPC
jgi:glycosyltransferase involved in cell wall biosynthesis